MPDLSVVICFYNAEKYIQKTLHAVCSQSFSDFELILINDCSNDRSTFVALRYLDHIGRKYKLYDFQANKGIAFARNYGLQVATTKYIVFIDADDLPSPTLFEREHKVLLSDPDLIGVAAWSQYIDENGKKIKGGLHFGDKTKEDFFNRAAAGKRIFLQNNTMFDREAALRVGGYTLTGFPDGKPRYQDYCEDLDLWTRMSDLYVEGKAIICIPEYLFSYRKINGLSSNHFNMIIKMDYVKYNVRRRRKGLKDVTFIEYKDSLDPQYLAKLKRDSKSADDLRNGVFYLHRGNVVKALGLVCSSIWNNPKYIVDKLIHNL